MTLDELLAECRKDDVLVQASSSIDPSLLLWWVVVLSHKPGPDGKSRVKFVAATASEVDANAERQRREDMERERIDDLRQQGKGVSPDTPCAAQPIVQPT